MELHLENFVNITASLGKENLFIETSNQVSSDHRLRLTDELEKVAVKGSLYNAIIELDDQHILFVATKSLRDQLASLDLVIVVPLLKFD